MDRSGKWLVDFRAGKTQLVSFDCFNKTGAIDVKMVGTVIKKKSSFKMLGLTLSSGLDGGSYIICVAKTASRKIGPLIHSMKFLYTEVGLYFSESIMWPCIECCCHIWTGALSCCLELLDGLQGRYTGQLVLHLLIPLNSWLIDKM